MALTPQQKIENKKAKLASGGLTQKQINTLISEIQALGGKVNPANFPKAGSTQMPPNSGYKPPAGGGTAPAPAPTPSAPNPASPSTPGPAGPAAVDPATGDVNNPASGYNLQKQPGVIGAQTTANVQAQNQNLNQNRVNQSSAYGGYTWTVGPDGRPVLTQSLSAPQQQMLENEQQRALGIDQAAGGMLSQIQGQGAYNFQGQDAGWGGYGNAPDLYGINDIEGTQSRVTDALMGKFESLNKASFAKQDEDFRQRMADQGIQEGSPDWAKRYQAEVQNPQAQAREQASFEAINRGGEEQQRMFNMSSQGRAQMTGESDQDYANRMSLRQQQISEYGTQRADPYQSMGALLGMRAGVKDPTMQNVYTNDMNPADITGLAAAFKAAKTDKQTTEMQGDTARDVAGIQAQAAKDVASINASASESGGGDFDGAYRNAQLNSQSGQFPLSQQTGGQQPQPMFSTAVQPQFRMQVGPSQGGIMANNPNGYQQPFAQQQKSGQATPGMMGTAPAGAQLYAQRRLGAASPASYTGGIMGAYPMMQ